MQQTPTPIEVLASAGFVSSAIVSYKLSRLADNKNDGEITFGFVLVPLLYHRHIDSITL